MKKKYVFLCGLALGVIFPLVLATNQYLTDGRYQLFFGKVMQLGADPNYQFEHPVCFRLDTQTGETRIYDQSRIGYSDIWTTVEPSEEFYRGLLLSRSATVVRDPNTPKPPEGFVLDSNQPNKP